MAAHLLLFKYVLLNLLFLLFRKIFSYSMPLIQIFVKLKNFLFLLFIDKISCSYAVMIDFPPFKLLQLIQQKNLDLLLLKE